MRPVRGWPGRHRAWVCIGDVVGTSEDLRGSWGLTGNDGQSAVAVVGWSWCCARHCQGWPPPLRRPAPEAVGRPRAVSRGVVVSRQGGVLRRGPVGRPRLRMGLRRVSESADVAERRRGGPRARSGSSALDDLSTRGALRLSPFGRDGRPRPSEVGWRWRERDGAAVGPGTGAPPHPKATPLYPFLGSSLGRGGEDRVISWGKGVQRGDNRARRRSAGAVSGGTSRAGSPASGRSRPTLVAECRSAPAEPQAPIDRCTAASPLDLAPVPPSPDLSSCPLVSPGLVSPLRFSPLLPCVLLSSPTLSSPLLLCPPLPSPFGPPSHPKLCPVNPGLGVGRGQNGAVGVRPGANRARRGGSGGLVALVPAVGRSASSLIWSIVGRRSSHISASHQRTPRSRPTGRVLPGRSATSGPDGSRSRLLTGPTDGRGVWPEHLAGGEAGPDRRPAPAGARRQTVVPAPPRLDTTVTRPAERAAVVRRCRGTAPVANDTPTRPPKATLSYPSTPRIATKYRRLAPKDGSSSGRVGHHLVHRG